MANEKTTHLNLTVTVDESTLFSAWRNQIDGNDASSDMQIIDAFAGKFAGGSSNQALIKKDNNKFSWEWRQLKTSDLNNDSGFITNAVNSLVNYYDKETINDLLGQIESIKLEIVEELPATGKASTIYLVPSAGSATGEYDEYLYVNSKWELIGTTAVDLTNYFTKNEINQLLANKANKSEIPVVNDSVITINYGESELNHFTLNQSQNLTITIPEVIADAVEWGNIKGSILDQEDLISYIDYTASYSVIPVLLINQSGELPEDISDLNSFKELLESIYLDEDDVTLNSYLLFKQGVRSSQISLEGNTSIGCYAEQVTKNDKIGIRVFCRVLDKEYRADIYPVIVEDAITRFEVDNTSLSIVNAVSTEIDNSLDPNSDNALSNKVITEQLEILQRELLDLQYELAKIKSSSSGSGASEEAVQSMIEDSTVSDSDSAELLDLFNTNNSTSHGSGLI